MEELLLRHLSIAALGVIGSFFGTLVGGSGLLILPVLIHLGFSAPKAVAILEVGALGMMLTGAYELNRVNKIDLNLALPLTLLSGLGTFFGALILIATPPLLAERIFGVGLTVLLLYMVFFKKKLSSRESEVTSKQVTLGRNLFGLVLFLLNGVWSGFLSAGSHILGSFILMTYYRKTIIQASGLLKIEGIGSGLISSLIFSLSGLVTWSAALALSLGMSLGSWLGCRWGLKIGEKWVEKLYILVVGISALRLLGVVKFSK
jgi:uncharacterized protein